MIDGFPERSHTELYTIPRAKIPLSIIIAGGGRSTIWLAQHFPETKIACIKYKDLPLPLLKNEKLPDNMTIYHYEDFAYTKRLRAFSAKDGDKSLSFILDVGNPERSFQGEFFAAIGLAPDISVTKAVDKDNLLIYPYSESLDWVAPEEVPIGSLMEATLRWAYATDNLDIAFQTNCFHEAYFSKMLSSFLQARQIKVDQPFFINLKKDICDSYKLKPGSALLQMPNDDEALEIYRQCYKRTYHDDKKANELVNALKHYISEMYVIYNNKHHPTLALCK